MPGKTLPPVTSTPANPDPLLQPILEDQGTPRFPNTGVRDSWGNGVDIEQIDYYKVQAADATLASNPIVGQIMADFPGFPGNNLNPQNFTLDQQVEQAFSSLQSYTQRLKFNEVTTHDGTVDMTLSESGAGSNYFRPNTLGRASSPEKASGFQSNGQYSAHATFNGTHSAVTGTNEHGAVGYKDFVVSHELGHTIGLSHPHLEQDSFINPSTGRRVFLPNPNDSLSDNANFQSGFALNNAQYTVMSYQTATPGAINYGHVVGYSALDIAALQHKYGIGDNNTGNTTYNLTDGAQITDPKSNNAPLDIDGADESRAELSQAFADAAKTGGVWEGMKAYGAKLKEQLKSGRFDGGEESIGRAYKTIYDGEREVDAAGNESIGNGGIDEISYAGSQQSAMINLNDAGLGADNTDAQYLDLQREIKGSGRWSEFNTEFQNEIDATANDATGTLRPDAYNAGGHFSKLYTTDAAGKVTATQDGGYSIANGSVIENATGGDKADTLIGNEHDNVLTGNKGADALYGGHGNDTLNGGDGNDALVAGRGNNALDGGADFDTASYKNYYDPSIGVPITQGISFSITGSQATVTKPLNGAIAGPAGASVETDSIQNVERFEGSDRDDVFTVENLSGNMYISGGAGNDTLTVKDPTGAYSLDMTGGTYPAGHPRVGESFTGTVSDGTNTIYLEDKDLNVTIDAPAPTPAPPTEKSAELGLEDAIEILAADQKTLNQQVSETGVSTPAHEAINHPDAFQMIGNLHAAGVSTLKAKIQPDMDIEDRVGNILNAGRDATQEAGLLMPHEERAQESEAELGADYAQPIAEPVYEDDYSYSM